MKIDDNSEVLKKVVIQSIIKNSTTRNVKRMRDLILHRYEDDQRVSLAVENKVRPLSMRVTIWYSIPVVLRTLFVRLKPY